MTQLCCAFKIIFEASCKYLETSVYGINDYFDIAPGLE